MPLCSATHPVTGVSLSSSAENVRPHLGHSTLSHVLLARPGRLAWFLRRLAKSAGRHRRGDLCPGVLNIPSYSSIIRRAGVGLCKLVLSVYSELSEPTQTCVCSWLHTCTKTKDNSMQKLEHKQSAHAQGPRTRLLHSSAVGHSDAHSQSSSNHSMMMMMFITIFETTPVAPRSKN